MTRLARALLLALLLCALAPASGHAAIAFKPCLDVTGEFECGELTVPIDRSGSVPGTIKLSMRRVKAAKPSGKAIFAFAGGPGQGATAFTADFDAQFRRTRRSHDLIVFDQRGTGESAPIDCREVDRVSDVKNAADQVRACGQKLGPSAPFYTTADSVLDIDAIRAELGYDKIALYGVSYGTKVELAYATTFPQHVSRMVLDSVVQLEGPDPLLRDSFRAVPRVLRELCRSAFCRGVTGDPVADMQAAVARMPLTGSVYDLQGKRETASIDAATLFTLLVIGDFEPRLRTLVPAAVRSAAQGDPAPLLRMAKLIEPPPNPQAPELEEFSTGLWLATVCSELPFPWDPDAPESERRAQAESRASVLDPAQFNPFVNTTALSWDIVEMCEHWPVSRRPAAGDLSAVQAPVLLVNGRADLRTPLENAEAMAARMPAAQVISIKEVGHSVAGSDPTGCAEAAIDDFISGRVPVPCAKGAPRLKMRPLAPTDANALTPAKGTSGKRGRTAKAVDLTIHDVLDELDLIYAERGGLRGGAFTFDSAGRIVFRGLVYVPGVKVSGRLNAFSFTGTLRVSGSQASRGTYTIARGGRVTAKLDGRTVKTRIKLPPAPEGLGSGDGEGGGEPRVPTWLGPLAR